MKTNKWALSLPVIAGSMFGAVAVFVRPLSDAGMNTVTILFSRAMLAAILLFLFLLFYDKNLLRVRLKDIWIFVMAGLIGTMALNICYNIAITELTVSLAAVLLSMSPVFVLILASIFFRERITLNKVIWMIVAIIGCVFVSGVITNSEPTMTFSMKGILAGIMSALFFALYSVFSKSAMEKGYHSFTITFYSMLVTGVAIILFTDFNKIISFVIEAPVGNSIFLIVHALVCCVLPYIVYTKALNYIDAGRVSIMAASTEPTAAMVFGLALFGEVPGITSVLGLVIVILAIVMLCKLKDN